MNPEDNGTIPIWADRLADSGDFAGDLGDDPELAESLAALASVARAFRQTQSHTAATAGTFDWGHLKVHECLGQGSFGTVYRAFDPMLQRWVALKLLQGESAGLANRHYIQEARRMARVRHPNVLAIHGADVHDGGAGLWADLIHGETLDLRMERGPVSVDEVLSIGRQLAAGLLAVHEAGLVHGDIKTSNVMIDQDGHVVLMDFGAAAESSGGDRLVFQGSPLSMAPEQFSAPPTQAADIYGLGVLLFQLLTGHYPVEAEDYEALKAAHARGERGNLKAMRAGLERPWYALIDSMLAPDPLARPDAQAVKEQLRRIAVLPETRVRRRLRNAAFAALSLALVAASIGYWRASVLQRAAESARSETSAINEFLSEMLLSPRNGDMGAQVRVADLLDIAALRLERDTRMPDAQRATLQRVIGASYAGLERFEPAVRHLEDSVALSAQVYGQNDPRTLESGIWLFDSLAEDCRVDEAKRVLAGLEPQVMQSLPGDAPERMSLMVSKAVLASCTGDNAGELRLAEEAIRALEAHGRSTSADHLRAVQRMAQAHMGLGDYAKAGALMRRELARLEQAFGNSHIFTAPARHTLITVLILTGDLVDAERLVRRNIEILTELHGPDHYDTLSAQQSLASLLEMKGQLEPALEINRKVHASVAREFGERSERALMMHGNVANVLKAMGRRSEAEAIYRDVIDGLGVLGEVGRTNRLYFSFNLTELLNEDARPAEALAFSQAVLDESTEVLGADHIVSLELLDARGASLLALGRADEAGTIHREALAAKARVLGEDAIYTLITRERLADALAAQGQHPEALQLWSQALEGYERLLGNEDARTTGLRAKLDQARAETEPDPA
jgi:tetratricopeptide (TPR) repeat protein